MHKDSKMIAKKKIKPMKVNFLILQKFFGKESFKSCSEYWTVPENREIKQPTKTTSLWTGVIWIVKVSKKPSMHVKN